MADHAGSGVAWDLLADERCVARLTDDPVVIQDHHVLDLGLRSDRAEDRSDERTLGALLKHLVTQRRLEDPILQLRRAAACFYHAAEVMLREEVKAETQQPGHQRRDGDGQTDSQAVHTAEARQRLSPPARTVFLKPS